MSTDTHTTGVSVELIVRSGTPAGGATTRTRRLADRGVFDRVEVTQSAEEVGLSWTTSQGAPQKWTLDRLAASRRWATREGVTVEPFIGTRELVEPVTGEIYTALIPPSRLLIEETDGEIGHVTPHIEDGVTKTVSDRLTELETELVDLDSHDAALANG